MGKVDAGAYWVKSEAADEKIRKEREDTCGSWKREFPQDQQNYGILENIE